MQTWIIDALIWYTGAIAWLIGLTVIAAITFRLLGYLCGQSAKRLMDAVRFETARYWALRLEKEGLATASTEYRRMVAERKPKTVRAYMNIDSESTAQQKGQS